MNDTFETDTSLPRFYDRELVYAEPGMYLTSPNIVFLDGVHPEEYWTGIENTEKLFNNATEYEDKYLPDFGKTLHLNKEILDMVAWIIS